MHEYHDDWNSLPPAYLADHEGRPRHSWRLLLLPYLGHQDLYDAYRFDEPWNGPNNREFVDQMPSVYACPADHEHTLSDVITSYVVLTGHETVFPDEHAISLDDILDGTAGTILLTEMADSGIPWLEPRDLLYDPAGFTVNLPDTRGASSYHRQGSNFAFCDASARFIRFDVHLPTLLEMVTIASDAACERVRPAPTGRTGG